MKRYIKSYVTEIVKKYGIELHRLYDPISEDRSYDLCLDFFEYNKDQVQDLPHQTWKP